MRRACASLAFAWFLIAAASVTEGTHAVTASLTWRLDSLATIGGHPVTVLGDPQIVSADLGNVTAFDGVDDGLFVEANPLQGLARFTLEILFQPAPGGGEEQRFLHVEDTSEGSRALIELRMRPDSQWALDTFLRSNENRLTLLDRARVHPPGRWHVAALTYDGRTMRHYVNGRLELEGEVAFTPMDRGRTSIGVRQTRVSWFKGLVHSVRITPEPLSAGRLMIVPSKAGPDSSCIDPSLLH